MADSVGGKIKELRIEAGSITVLCSGFKHRITNLRIVDGAVWFASGDTVYQIKDNMLYSFKTDVKEIVYLAVSGGSVFVFSYEYVDSGENGDSGNSGNGGSSQIFVNSFTRDVITKTVYGGKLYFQYGSTVLEYSDGGVRTFHLDDAED